ncbi:helix-turn-helix domain-containing protein [bacterium]|nr:helix-turn-helix domain-containing protein [bacterium]
MTTTTRLTDEALDLIAEMIVEWWNTEGEHEATESKEVSAMHSVGKVAGGVPVLLRSRNKKNQGGKSNGRITGQQPLICKNAPKLEIETYSMAQVAKALAVAPETVRGWIDRGELSAFNIGRGAVKPRFRITKASLDSFLSSRAVQPVTQRASKHKPPIPQYV